MTEKEMLDMKLHTVVGGKDMKVLRVVGGWVYVFKNTSVFVQEKLLL